MDIKKQIEEIDESKKEQVCLAFHFILVVPFYECFSHEITGSKGIESFMIELSSLRSNISTTVLKGMLFGCSMDFWIFNGFKEATGLC